jgi:hypothetical protein
MIFHQDHATIPFWLLLKVPSASANALMVYAHLTLRGTPKADGTYEYPATQETLAENCRLGVQVVGRALRELEALGAIAGERSYDAGQRRATVYRTLPEPTGAER